MAAATVVDDFDSPGYRIPLDVERLIGLLAAEVGCMWLEIVVIRLPYHGWPA